ncbi:hypothetical protein B0H10DRAFT_2218096 [Mycena sp. CBHHK59/15]|nr:hypothetical protein B0H10DRAFT_2218096 [Mycena sp. CBHHK59/15]
MGRWTVAEWQAQASYSYSLPGGRDFEYDYGGATSRNIDIVLEDHDKDDDGYTDEDDGDGESLGSWTSAWAPDVPPIPPPKPKPISACTGAPTAAPGVVDRLLGVMAICKNGPHARSTPKSNAKSKSKPKANAKPQPDYTYPRGGLEVFVSTQTIAVASLPDARRAHVFFPRSSSLAAVRKKPLPAHPHALPALPVSHWRRRSSTSRSDAGAHRRSSTRSKGKPTAPRIRPLPVPVRVPAAAT